MSKSLCTFNHLLVEELQGIAALCLEIKKKSVDLPGRSGSYRCCVDAGERHRAAPWARGSHQPEVL